MSDALVSMERLNGGEPILRPQGEGWESGAVSNAAVIYLHRSSESATILRRLLRDDNGSEPDLNADRRLSDGAVVLCYQARPRAADGEESPKPAPSIGLAVFTPGLELIKRLPEPVFGPSDDPQAADSVGVETPRITWVNGAFWMAYGGISTIPGTGGVEPRICMVRSSDLLHWERLGPVPGDLAQFASTDGVLLPEPVNGEYVLMHRSPVAASGESALCLTTTSNLDGYWRERGAVLSPVPDSRYEESWLTPGTTPVALGDRRFLIFYNSGHWVKRGELRRGNLGAAILNLQHPRLDEPRSVVEARLDPVLVPETMPEVVCTTPGAVPNVLFTCGMFEHHGSYFVVYSSGETVLHAARIAKDELTRALENAGRAATAAPSTSGSSSGSW